MNGYNGQSDWSVSNNNSDAEGSNGYTKPDNGGATDGGNTGGDSTDGGNTGGEHEQEQVAEIVVGKGGAEVIQQQFRA